MSFFAASRRGMLLAFALSYWPAHAAAAADELSALDELEALDELDALDDGAGQSTSFKLQAYRASVSQELHSYPWDRNGPQNDEALVSEARLELDVDLVGSLSFFTRPWFLIDSFDTDLLRYEPLELSLTTGGESWDFTFGQVIESWGIADAYNPIDVLNRRDFGPDLIDPVQRGELMYRLAFRLPGGERVDQVEVSAYALPLWRRTELPTDDSRFSLSALGRDLVRDETLEPSGADSLFGALRLEHSLSTSVLNADMQYIAAAGPERMPLIVPVPGPTGVSLVPAYHGFWMVGGGLRAVPNAAWWSKLTLKAEIAYKRPYSLEDVPVPAPDDYVQYVVGFDRVFAPFVASRDQLTVTVEYLGESGANDEATLLRPFASDAATRLAWELNDFSRTSVELSGLVDVETGEIISELSASRQLRFIHDDLKLEAHGRYLREGSGEPSLLSFFPNNSRWGVRAQFDF